MAIIGLPPQSTNLGPPPNFDKITHIGTGYSMATNTPGVIGSYTTIRFAAASVANSQTALVLDQFISTARMRIINLSIVAGAITATATVTLYNSTQAANVAAALTPTTTPVVTTTITTPVVEKNDILQLLSTTNGSGALTSVVMEVTVEYLSSPLNAHTTIT